MTSLRYVVAAAILVLVAFPLRADSVLPGGTVSPDVFTLTSMPPILGQTSGTFNVGGITGTYTDYVLVDPFGVTCAGCLDFAFEIGDNSSSAGSIQDVFFGAFPGLTTDVGYVPMSGGGIDPSSVSRGSAGVDMEFALASLLSPGGSTDVFVIATNATNYVETPTGGNGVLQLTGTVGSTVETDASITTSGGLFVPKSVAEPSSFFLLGSGLLGLMGIAVKRKRLN